MRLTGAALLFIGLMTGTAWLSVATAQDKTPARKDATAGKDAQDLLLETIGTLAGAHLYQSYLNIGFIADGRAEGTYEEQDIQQILASVLELMDALDKKLDAVAKLDLPKEDRDAVAQLRKLSGLLRLQADELQAFWKTNDKARSEKYEKTRKEAWDGISKLLNLK